MGIAGLEVGPRVFVEDYLRDLTAKISEIASIFQAERTLVMGSLGRTES